MSPVLKVVTLAPHLTNAGKEPPPPTPPPKPSGIRLGDMVAAIAQPIAKAIDAVAKTHVAQCGGCKARQEYLNKLTAPKNE